VYSRNDVPTKALGAAAVPSSVNYRYVVPRPAIQRSQPTTATDPWAVWYPATHELHVLERKPADGAELAPLEARSARIHASSRDLSRSAHVLIAPEPMDPNPGWRPTGPGELVHVGADLAVTATFPFPEAPAHPLTPADYDPSAAASQRP